MASPLNPLSSKLVAELKSTQDTKPKPVVTPHAKTAHPPVTGNKLAPPDVALARLGHQAPPPLPPRDHEPKDKVLLQAQTLGLDPTKQTQLKALLNNSPQSAAMLQDVLAKGGHADRTLETFLQLKGMQAQESASIKGKPNETLRLTDSVVESLTRGVGIPRDSHAGPKGILTPAQALNAAHAWTHMDQKTFTDTNFFFHQARATQSKSSSPADQHTKGALFLKAVGARESQLVSSDTKTRDAALTDLWNYSEKSFATSAPDLVKQTSLSVPPRQGQPFLQKWNDSCGPTTVQMLEAERDPVRALTYNQNIKIAPQGGSAVSVQPIVAAKQKQNLEAQGGKAVQRGHIDGDGITNSKLAELVAKETGQSYEAKNIWFGQRGPALDSIDAALRQGHEVPVSVDWGTEQGHFLLMTDVKGQKGAREFHTIDPWSGKTAWIPEAELLKGQTDFLCGTGKLDGYAIPKQ